MDISPITVPIQADLDRVDEVMAARLQSEVSFITTVAHYITQNGGKRVRPAILLLAARMAGYTGNKAVECAAALEFCHTATLLHDDVIDNAELRRGRKSANAKWGNHASVLIGDFFYCRASEMFANSDSLKVVQLITRAMRETTEGETLEITKSNSFDITEDDYLKIIHAKTAILIATAAEMGGLLGNVSEELIRGLKEYGTSLGIAFQLADDVLDYVSDEENFGKTQGTDLREGKLTLPIIVALKHADESEVRMLKDALISEKLEDFKLKEIISLIQKLGGIDYTLNLARHHVAKAKSALSVFKNSIEKEALVNLASYVIERNQ
jgi:octaprenyl-diphosphate synthase